MAKRYVITHRKDDGVWQVKLAKGAKVIKLFNTQKEAIDYAEALAENQDGSITIHKKDGKIRKQNYQQKKPAKEEQPEEETETLTSMMNRQMNNPDIVDAKPGESDNHKDNVEQL